MFIENGKSESEGYYLTCFSNCVSIPRLNRKLCFANVPAFNLSEAAPTNLAIEKLNTCERAVWR